MPIIANYLNSNFIYSSSLSSIDQESYLILLIKKFVMSFFSNLYCYNSIEITIYCLFFALLYFLLYSASLRNILSSSSNHISGDLTLLRIKKLNIFNNLIFIITICVALYMVQLSSSYFLVPYKAQHSFFIFDFYSNFLGHLILIFFLFCLKLSEKYSLSSIKLNTIEYPLILCFSVIFLLLLIASFDFMSLYLTIEGLSLTLYVLAAYDISSSGAIEASLKYFCLGAIASGFLGFGVSLLYGSVGTLNYFKILYFLASVNFNLQADYLITLGLSFICFGFFFKLSIPPFHS